MALPAHERLLLSSHGEEFVARDRSGHVRVLARDVVLRVADELVVVLAADDVPALACDRLRHQTVAGAGSSRTITVSATLTISSTGRSARSACSRIFSGLDAW